MDEKIEVGDQFQDLDRRNVNPRVVRVLHLNPVHRALVENVEHWNSKLIGRRTEIALDRLADPRLFRKISR